MRTSLFSFLFAALLVLPAIGQKSASQSFNAVPALRSTVIRLRPTERQPDARGWAKIHVSGQTSRVEVRLDEMRPATLFGGDYNTYVLWTLPPDGHARNGGECVLISDSCRIETSVAANTFAIFVTAEPHFGVSEPSRFVVLALAPNSDLRPIEDRGVPPTYNYERDTLAGTKRAGGPVSTDVAQAIAAVRLAQRAEAGRFASDRFGAARLSLETTLRLSREKTSPDALSTQARQTVRLAAEAQHLAENRVAEMTERGINRR